MNYLLKYLIAICLFATLLFAQPAVAQQVQFTLVNVNKGEIRMSGGATTETIAQSYTVQVPYTENVEQSYTVQVPYTESVLQQYTVLVPYTETVKGPDGKEKEIKKNRTEVRERMVPVKRKRAETRIKMVPVQRVRTETRIRQVPVTVPNAEMKAVKFPPAGAKFAYVSGEEISSNQIKELAKTEITILQLQAGESLTDLQRKILKPDLIVMTMSSKKKSEKRSEK